VDGTHLLIADSPDDFAEAVVRMMNEPQLRQKLIEEAYRFIQNKYDWDVILPTFLNLVHNVSTNH
jgi:glycosyltransferase involved in cell wall biosynthesis